MRTSQGMGTDARFDMSDTVGATGLMLPGWGAGGAETRVVHSSGALSGSTSDVRGGASSGPAEGSRGRALPGNQG